MDINPLVAREMRARWRSPRAFGLIFAYVAVLTVAMVGSYGYSSAHLFQGQSHQRLSLLGHHMFQTLTWMQTLAWLLVAPALTATSIAAERERGLLESMQLSRLTPWHVVSGKLLAAGSYMLLILLVPLPIIATCFIMGGVSPGEFMLATMLEIVTAVNCAVLGLLCSAWSRRAGEALRAAFALVILWAVTSGVAFPIAATVWRTGGGSSLLETVRLQLDTLYAYTNPVLAAYAITDPSMTSGVYGGGLANWVLKLPVWAISLSAQATGALALLVLATRGAAKPLDADPVEDQDWGRRRQRQRDAPAASRPHTPGTGAPVALVRPRLQSGFWELPLARSLHFANPVLQRELHSRLRSRHPSRVMLALEAGIGLFLLYGFGRALWWALFSPDARGGLWWGICNLLLLITMFTSALMGAATFTRERETGTWEGIQLSLLSPATIVAGKLATPLVVCLLLSMPFWPILLLCIRALGEVTSGSGQSIWFRSGVTLSQAVATLGMWTATAWCYTAWGMWLSWRCRNTATATGWVVGTLFVPLVIVPALAGTLGASSFSTNDKLQTFLDIFHPFYALANVLNNHDQGPEVVARLMTTSLCVALHFAVGCGLLLALYLAMRRGTHRRARPVRDRNPRFAFNV